MPDSPRSARRPRHTARRRSPQPPLAAHPEAAQRLQKVLAAGGVGSRRECEQIILEGRVEVDRQVVRELGSRVDPDTQEIRVDGVVLRQAKRSYFAVNKPIGVLSTNRDPAGRERVIDLLPTDQRVYSVGRLDRSSEGLMLVTNDGELAFRLTHPRYGVPKTYWVQVAGSPEPEQLAQLRRGVHLAEGVAKVASLKIRRRRKSLTELEIVLDEGRNREIRRLLARIGHKVVRLKRVAIGPLRLGNLPTGGHRRLSAEEIGQLRDAVRQEASGRRARPSRGAPRPPSRERPSRGKQKPGKGGGGAGSAGTAPASRRPPEIQPRPAGVIGYDGDYQPSQLPDEAAQAQQKTRAGSGRRTARPPGRSGRSGSATTGQSRGQRPAAGKGGSSKSGGARPGKPKASKSKASKPKASKSKGAKAKAGKPKSGKPRAGKKGSRR